MPAQSHVAPSSNRLLATLAQLRDRGDRCRAELYWNRQRLLRSLRDAAGIRDYWYRRKRLCLYTPPPELIADINAADAREVSLAIPPGEVAPASRANTG